MRIKIITILLIGAITVFGIHILNMNTEGARVDLTETNLYSLTEGTREILKKMHDEGVKPIDIKLYFSATNVKQLPQFIKQFISYEAYVRNLLKEYERYSNGKIRLQFIDPKTDSDEAEDAADYRLDGKPINEHGDMVYFGLVFVTQTGSKDVIDFLWPEKQDSIEYEISKRIHSLLWPKKQRIAILSGVDIMPDADPYMAQLMRAQGKAPSEPWVITQLLQETYTVNRIDEDVESISPDDYDLLMVVHPKNLSEKALWNVNEWVVTGGETIVLLDAYSIEDKAPENPQQPWAQLQYQPSSNMEKLLSVWGVERPENMFALDYELGHKGPIDRRGTVEKNVVDLVISDKNIAKTLNQDLPIFQGLSNLRFYMAGVLEKKGDVKAEITPLITTTKEGDAVEIKPGFGDGKDLAYTDLGEPTKILNRYSPSGVKTLAFMISGVLDSAFPEGATFPKDTPKPPPGMPPGFQMPPDENAEMITKEAISKDRFHETRVMVFSDSDFISDRVAFQQSLFGVQAVNDNHKLLLNSIDFLLGAEELMKVRSKSRIQRPFSYFDRIEEQADKDMLEQEQRIRNDIARFQDEVREKQRGMNQKDAVLFQKKLGDEVNELNEKIRAGEKQLREIKKKKRAVLEREERFVRMSIVWFMPVLICLAGLMNWYSNYRRKAMAGRRD